MLSVTDICYIATCALLLCFYIPMKIEQRHRGVLETFKDYLERYNKSYENATEYKQRLQIFQDSLALIETLNAASNGSGSAKYGLTRFSDLTPDEFVQKQLQKNIYGRVSRRKLENSDDSEENAIKRFKRSISKLPEKVDWRQKNVIGKVISQKQCGACWAFTVIENIESMYAIQTGRLESLSVQQLVDCAYKNAGCNGGDMCTALEWLQSTKTKVRTEDDYPFLYKSGFCRVNRTAPGVQLVDYACDYLGNNEGAILNMLATYGPVGVAINAYSWQHYLGGVIQYHCNSSVLFLNHAVQIVGYDLTASIPHYIVKNSWGENFGNDGYLYVGIGNNLCGLGNEVTAVKVAYS